MMNYTNINSNNLDMKLSDTDVGQVENPIIYSNKKKTHIFTKNVDGLFKCEYCYYVTKNKNTLSMHIRSKHNMEAGWLNEHSCELCEYTTSLKTKLNQHIDKYHLHRFKQCPFCNNNYKMDGLYTHIYNHHISKKEKYKYSNLSNYMVGKIIFERHLELENLKGNIQNSNVEELNDTKIIKKFRIKSKFIINN